MPDDRGKLRGRRSVGNALWTAATRYTRPHHRHHRQLQRSCLPGTPRWLRIHLRAHHPVPNSCAGLPYSPDIRQSACLQRQRTSPRERGWITRESTLRKYNNRGFRSVGPGLQLICKASQHSRRQGWQKNQKSNVNVIFHAWMFFLLLVAKSLLGSPCRPCGALTRKRPERMLVNLCGGFLQNNASR